MSKNKHIQIEEGEEVIFNDIKTTLHYLACCDCGLTHLFDFKIKNGDLIVKVWRDNRITSQLRRHRDYDCKEAGMAKKKGSKDKDSSKKGGCKK